MKSEPKRCTQCVLSGAFPGIEFNQLGICNFCRDQSFCTTDDAAVSRAKVRIETLFAERSRSSEYDAVLCYSGGKDSTLALIRAVSYYGLKVLAFTMDNGFMSPAAFDNIQTVVKQLWVDHMLLRPSDRFFKRLIRATTMTPIYHPKSLLRISAGCNSCISLVNNLALRCALEKSIPFIIAGFNLGQIPSNAIVYKNHYKFLQESREPVLKKLRNLVGEDVDDYLCISERLIAQTQTYPHTVNLLCLENCDEKAICDEITAYGWRQPMDVDGCSSNCRLNIFNNHAHEMLYQFHPYELELSHLIRKRLLSRDEALRKLADHSEEQLEWIMSELGINHEQLIASTSEQFERT